MEPDRKRRSLQLAILAGALIVGLALVFLGRSSGWFASPQSELIPVKMMDCINMSNIHVLIAKKMGFFEDEGLDVELSYTSIGKLSMDALNNRAVDYAGVVEMNVAHTLFSKDDVAILAEMGEPMNSIKLLGRSDRGVTTSNDLRGKKIAVFFGVNIHIFITKVLQEAGVPLDDVALVSLKPPDAVAAFVSGDVDAIVTWEPLAHRAQTQLGERAVTITEDSQRYWPYKMILATRRSYLQTHSDEAKAVLRALLKADEFIEQNPKQSYALVAEHMLLDAALVAQFADEIHYEIRLTDRLVEMIAFEVAWLPENLPDFLGGRQPVISDFGSLMAMELQSVAPEAVQTTP